MRFQITALFLCLAANTMAQKKIYFDCALQNEVSEKIGNYAIRSYKKDTVTYKYYNSRGIHLKTTTFLEYDQELTKWGPETLMNIDGSIYSTGYYKNGKRHGLFITIDRSGLIYHSLYNLDTIQFSIAFNSAGDTIEHKTYLKNGTIKYIKKSEIKHSYTYYNKYGKIDSVVEVDVDTISLSTNSVLPVFKYDLNKFLSEHLEYPRLLAHFNVCARVRVRFIIQPNGRVSNVRVEGPTTYHEFEEAARMCIIQTDGLWIPGSLYGDAVKTETQIEIDFNLYEEQFED